MFLPMTTQSSSWELGLLSKLDCKHKQKRGHHQNPVLLGSGSGFLVQNLGVGFSLAPNDLCLG